MYFGIFETLRDLNMSNSKDSDLYEGYFSNVYEEMTNRNDYDINFIMKHALGNERKNGILELACGSGRLLTKLAQKGFNVTGLELSNDMIDICRSNIEMSTVAIKRRTEIIQGNMISFDLNKKFSLIILSATSICLLEKEEDIVSMFEAAYNHLEIGGQFIFDYVSDNSNHNLKLRDGRVLVVNTKKTDELGHGEFVLMGEEMDYKTNIGVLNLYAEVVTDKVTQRYFGYSKKKFHSEEVISKIIHNSPFSLVSTEIFSEEDAGTIKAVVLKKLA